MAPQLRQHRLPWPALSQRAVSTLLGVLALLLGLPYGCREAPQHTGTTGQSESLGLVFVRIPAGEWRMGSETAGATAQPVHTVRISKPFDLGKYEVTQAQWQQIMGINLSQVKGANLPVESVSWDDVQTFLKKLNAREPGVRYRLPTEAEWEYAARGSAGRTYPWGNRFDGKRLNACDQRCKYPWKEQGVDDGYATTAPVGSYAEGQSPFGVHDMAGNVWEWVADRYAPDAYKARAASGQTVVDPRGPETGVNRGLRGGSWNDAADHCQAAHRGYAHPDNRLQYVGFRLLREVP